MNDSKPIRKIKGRFTSIPAIGALVSPPARYEMKPMRYEIIKANPKSVIIRGIETGKFYQVIIDEKTDFNVFYNISISEGISIGDQIAYRIHHKGLMFGTVLEIKDGFVETAEFPYLKIYFYQIECITNKQGKQILDIQRTKSADYYATTSSAH